MPTVPEEITTPKQWGEVHKEDKYLCSEEFIVSINKLFGKASMEPEERHLLELQKKVASPEISLQHKTV